MVNETNDLENEGRLEVRRGGIWTAVCNTSWGQDEADIACRQLGYSGALIANNDTVFNETGLWQYSYSWLDNVTCTGDELFIWDCDHNGPEENYYYYYRPDIHYCGYIDDGYRDYVYLVCQPNATCM